MTEEIVSSGKSITLANGPHLADEVAQKLEEMLSAGNYDGVKSLLEPFQPVDIAEAIGNLPKILQALAFRLLTKDEAIDFSNAF